MYRIKDRQSLVLASGSPRRSEMLRRLGLDFEVFVPDIDEQVKSGELSSDLVLRLAIEKAQFVANQRPSSWILAADTVVVVDQIVLGKPVDMAQAHQMLSQLSGRWHQVVGGLALLNVDHGYQKTVVDVTDVKMATFTDQQILAYCNSSEPFDKAGGYAIQGLAAHFIEQISGSYTNVIGLNLAQVVSLLLRAKVLGVDVDDSKRSFGSCQRED